jgi:hypothetical protein
VFDAPSKSLNLVLAGACALFAAAIAVRAIPPAQSVAPQDVVEEAPHIAEPMQFLGSGAKLRAAELDAWISADRRSRFKALRELAFHLDGCPDTRAWLDSVEGQRLERMLGELRSGKREEAFAALALTFQLARATEWKPGILTKTSSANVERLASLFQDWLRTWGEKSAKDSLLAEPATAAVLVYGRLMRVAQRAPMLGTSDAPYKRAQTFLGDLLGEGRSRRTALGERMQARSSAAIARLSSADDALRGLDEEALVMFPDLNGACDK